MPKQRVVVLFSPEQEKRIREIVREVLLDALDSDSRTKFRPDVWLPYAPDSATQCGLSKVSQTLLDEFQYYLDNQDSLVKKYNGKVIVIKNQNIIGVFDSDLEAVDRTTEEHELGTFLVQKCMPGNTDYTVTY